MRTWFMRSSGRSRGQALVEFALVAPLFLMLLFGVIEYSLINASVGAYNFAAKDGAREGAILGKGGAPGPGGTTIDADTYIVNNIILPRLSGLVIAQMSKIEIFHASETGACIITGSGSSAACEEDIWTPSGGTWSSTSNTWQSYKRNDQLANADYLGVKISYSYTYLTALLAITTPQIYLTATSVQRIEPQEYGKRAPQQLAALVASDLGARFLLSGPAQDDILFDTRRAHIDISGGRA
ncbi:MAG TPA: TadE family protein [Ktedonobacterales bacterium]